MVVMMILLYRQEVDLDIADCSTNTIPNEYRQHQEGGTCNQLQITQYEHMQGSSSLSWVRANFVRQLTEAFIIPLKSIELTRQIGEGIHEIMLVNYDMNRSDPMHMQASLE